MEGLQNLVKDVRWFARDGQESTELESQEEDVSRIYYLRSTADHHRCANSGEQDHMPRRRSSGMYVFLQR